VRPIREYGAAYWDPYREGQINALERVQRKSLRSDSVWEILAQRSKTARIFALFKEYSGERACKTIGDRLQGSCYLSRDDHDRKISARKQTTGIGKYCFIETNIQLWNQLPAEALVNFSCRSYIYKKRVRKVIVNEVK